MIDINVTRKLSELSKISFSEEGLEMMTEDMKEIIKLMDKVKEIDSEGESCRTKAVDYDDLREDFIKESYETEKILENAKEVRGNSFVVPKVV